MRILILLLISFSSYGQALNLLGFNRQLEASTVIVPSTLNMVDDDTYGTGNNQITYTGTWAHGQGKDGTYEGSYSYGNTTNGTAVMDFTGVKLDLYMNTYPTHGIAAVSIDGGAETMIDLYGVVLHQVLKYSSGALTDGPHTATVRVTGTSNPLATAPQQHWVEIDAFGVWSTETNPPVVVTGDWYVDQSVVSSGDGTTLGTAFKTIPEAAAVAQPGDEVTIMAGTYRETITPTNNGTAGNPIVYKAGEAGVIISGLETADGGWTVHSGNIYKKTITLPVASFTPTITGNTTIAANQVFKSGVMIVQARWPKANTIEAAFDKANLRQRNSTSTWNGNTITDASMPNIDWSGGKIFISGWYTAQTGNILTHPNATTITYNGNNTSSNYCQWYYLTGKLAALTQANEFHYESGILYVWQTGGGSPTGIEYKARNYGFDLTGKNYITITGIKFKGCEINGNTSTTNIIIDNCRFEHQNHIFLLEAPNGPKDKLDNSLKYNMQQTGLKLYGTGNIVRNSEFKYAGSQGVTIGTNGLVENNLFEWFGYDGVFGGPVAPYVSADNVKVLHNTMRDNARTAFYFGWLESDTHTNLEIAYNDIQRFGWLSSDGGGIYANLGQVLDGTRVHHNWIHNSKSIHSPTAGAAQGANAGLYYDQATGSNTINDHNVLWDNYQLDLHIVTGGAEGNRGNADFFNNTLVTKIYVINDNYVHGYFSYMNITAAYDDVTRNTIHRARHIGQGFGECTTNGQAGFDVQGSLFRSVSDLTQIFVGGTTYNPTTVADPAAYFQLSASSPGRGIGVAVAGYNDGDTAPKDSGAYYYGQTAWTAGYVAVTYVP